MTKKARQPRPLAVVILNDILLTALALVVFAYFHHVKPSKYESTGRISARPTVSISAVKSTNVEEETDKIILPRESASEKTKELTTENISEDTEESVTENDPEGTEEPVTEVVPEDTEESVTENDPEGMEEPVSENDPEGTEEPVTEGIPEGTEEPVTEGIPEGTEEPVTESIPENRGKPVMEIVPEDMKVSAKIDENEGTEDEEHNPTEQEENVITEDVLGNFSLKYADKFTKGEPVEKIAEDGTITYIGNNVNITVTKSRIYEGEYLFADIYVRDITNFQTALAHNQYGKGIRDWTYKMASEHNAILAINGDYYGGREYGPVIRNGVIYRDKRSSFDICVLYWDGSMRTYSPRDYVPEEEVKKGVYQAWSFGPMLLDQNGQPMKDFNSSVKDRNPRTVIGYFEPGHYCFVAVNGRTTASRGLKMDELSELMYNLGCKAAYNLDGGETSVMTWGDQIINTPYNGGRRCTDIVMIAE